MVFRCETASLIEVRYENALLMDDRYEIASLIDYGYKMVNSVNIRLSFLRRQESSSFSKSVPKR